MVFHFAYLSYLCKVLRQKTKQNEKEKNVSVLAAGIVALASCNTPQKEVVKIAAINPANMDTTVAAGTDFL